MKQSAKCECGQRLDNVTVFPLRCRRGRKIKSLPKEFKPQPKPRHRAKECWKECTSNQCGNFDDGCNLFNGASDSPLSVENRKRCRTFDHIYNGDGCFADPPLFGPAEES
jgi:hypothetical protein